MGPTGTLVMAIWECYGLPMKDLSKPIKEVLDELGITATPSVGHPGEWGICDSSGEDLGTITEKGFPQYLRQEHPVYYARLQEDFVRAKQKKKSESGPTRVKGIGLKMHNVSLSDKTRSVISKHITRSDLDPKRDFSRAIREIINASGVK